MFLFKMPGIGDFISIFETKQIRYQFWMHIYQRRTAREQSQIILADKSVKIAKAINLQFLISGSWSFRL